MNKLKAYTLAHETKYMGLSLYAFWIIKVFNFPDIPETIKHKKED